MDGMFGRDYFDGGRQVVGAYTHYTAEAVAPWFRDLSALLTRTFGAGRALDVGCAKGYLVAQLYRDGWDAHGTDISRYAIGAAETAPADRLQVCACGREPLPYPDDWFDLLTCISSIEFFSDLDLALREFARVLRPGGVLVLTTTDDRLRPVGARVHMHAAHFWRRILYEHGFRHLPARERAIRALALDSRLGAVLQGRSMLRTLAGLAVLRPLLRRVYAWRIGKASIIHVAERMA